MADAYIGATIGLLGVDELLPLPLSQTAFIVGYALVCSPGVNDGIKAVRMAHHYADS